MLRNHRFADMTKSGISQQSSFTVVRTHCAGTLCCWNLRWFSAFDVINKVKYAFVRKFIEVCVCQKLSKYSLVWQSYYKIKWCSLLTHMLQRIIGLMPAGQFLTLFSFRLSTRVLQRSRHSDVDDLRWTAAEAFRTTKKTSVGKHISGVRVQCPAITAAGVPSMVVCPCRWDSDETVVKRETMTNWVLPATTDVRAPVVRERRHDSRVDLSQRTSVTIPS